jgi:hypothetical protein
VELCVRRETGAHNRGTFALSTQFAESLLPAKSSRRTPPDRQRSLCWESALEPTAGTGVPWAKMALDKARVRCHGDDRLCHEPNNRLTAQFQSVPWAVDLAHGTISNCVVRRGSGSWHIGMMWRWGTMEDRLGDQRGGEWEPIKNSSRMGWLPKQEKLGRTPKITRSARNLPFAKTT